MLPGRPATASRGTILWASILLVQLCVLSALDLQPVSRRNVLKQATFVSGTSWLLGPPLAAFADGDGGDGIRKTIKVTLEGPNDSLGVQIVNTKIRGRDAVVISRVTRPKSPMLQEGMVLVGYSSALDFVERVRYGPFPVSVEFLNLAAGGDAISDLGTPILSPKDALNVVQQTEDNNGMATGRSSQPQQEYKILTISRPESSNCAIQTRRGDVIEMNYEASYQTRDGKKMVYDSSLFRGTGRPYQMVLGSGDMIPGVDQGMYDMCPGERRVLSIPPALGYGPRARDNFRIPADYIGLEWEIELVSIDGTIRQDNNNVSRQEREGRAAY